PSSVYIALNDLMLIASGREPIMSDQLKVAGMQAQFPDFEAMVEYPGTASLVSCNLHSDQELNLQESLKLNLMLRSG
ncbi:hypothetical protein BGX26_007473, partial [Mortierella sp. AD094]